MKNEDQIKALIKDAFPLWCEPPDLSCLSLAERVEIRQDAVYSIHEQLIVYLPKIMIDLIDSDDDTRKGTDLLIMHLNVDVYEDIYDAYYVFMNEHEKEYLKERRGNTFFNFTRDQAYAIYEWLQYVQTLTGLEFYPADMKGALNYWYERSCGQVHLDSPEA